MEELILSSKTNLEFKEKLLKEIKKRGIDLSRQYKTMADVMMPVNMKRLCIIIDGPTLSFALAEKNVANAFFKLGLIASSVICCRVSPK